MKTGNQALIVMSALLLGLVAAVATQAEQPPQPARASIAEVPPFTPMRDIAEVPEVSQVPDVPKIETVKAVGEQDAAPPSELAPPVPDDYQRMIRDDHERNTLYFTWAPASMDPLYRLTKRWPEDSYRICLFIGDSCESAKTKQVFEVVRGARDIPPYRYRPSRYGQKADLAFQGQQFNWSVAACIRETNRCSDYSPALPINWTQPRLPVLRFPKADAVRSPMVTTDFRWDATADVDHYLLCLAKPDVPCPSEPAAKPEQLMVIKLPSTQRYAYLEQLLEPMAKNGRVTPYQRVRLDGQKMQWNAAVCRDGKCQYRTEANPITFDRGPATLYIRNVSSQDINQVWLLGPDDEKTPLTLDLSAYQAPTTLAIKGGHYDDSYLAHVARHHLGIQEPNVIPYYRIEYISAPGGSIFTQGAVGTSHTSLSFAPGITHVPEYEVVRETLFITDDGTYLEQVLRAPDGQRYLYRPGGSFAHHPQAGPGPVPLEAMRDEGYDPY